MAYHALVDTVAGLHGDSKRSFKKDFNNLCSKDVAPNIASGCAILGINFNSGAKRDISTYYYQVCSVITLTFHDYFIL